MRFLCDVHISYKIVNFLSQAGFETIHVNSILDKWFTKDKDIRRFADENDYILLTKDSDFRESYFIQKSPKKLIKINLGNISNEQLIHILKEVIAFLPTIKELPNFLIEIDKKEIIYMIDEWGKNT